MSAPDGFQRPLGTHVQHGNIHAAARSSGASIPDTVVTGMFIHGATRSVYCSPGFEAVMGTSPEVQLCILGNWTAPILTCAPARCPAHDAYPSSYAAVYGPHHRPAYVAYEDDDAYSYASFTVIGNYGHDVGYAAHDTVGDFVHAGWLFRAVR